MSSVSFANSGTDHNKKVCYFGSDLRSKRFASMIDKDSHEPIGGSDSTSNEIEVIDGSSSSVGSDSILSKKESMPKLSKKEFNMTVILLYTSKELCTEEETKSGDSNTMASTQVATESDTLLSLFKNQMCSSQRNVINSSNKSS